MKFVASSNTEKLNIQGAWERSDMYLKDDQNLYIFATGSRNDVKSKRGFIHNAHHCKPIESKINVPDVR